MESSTTRATVGIGSGGRYPHAPGSDSSRAILDGTSRNRPQRLLGSHPQRQKRRQSSLSWVPSSIFMSLNSLDSNISPHSLHSTNSDSSSRLTICTRGQLVCVGTSATLGDGVSEMAAELADYATRVFGEPFGEDSLIGESVLAPDEFLKGCLVKYVQIPVHEHDAVRCGK